MGTISDMTGMDSDGHDDSIRNEWNSANSHLGHRLFNPVAHKVARGGFRPPSKSAMTP